MRQIMASMGSIDLEHRILQLERRVADLTPEINSMRRTLDALLAMAVAEATAVTEAPTHVPA